MVEKISGVCEALHMPTNLAINDRLLEEALKWGKLKTKRETVDQALDLFIRVKRRKGILSLAGKVEKSPHYSYKKERASR